MDGLIPMVYKSLKKNKIRRQYQCLSSSATAVPVTHTYNIADFYMNENDHHHHQYLSRKNELDQNVIPGPDKVSDLAHHRRYNSVHVGGCGARGGFGLEEEEDEGGAAKPKQLVRFRSHRMFSCVTGA